MSDGLGILWEYSGNAHTGVEVPEWSDSIFVQYVDYQTTSLRQYWYHYASIYRGYVVCVCHGDQFYDYKAGAFT